MSNRISDRLRDIAAEVERLEDEVNGPVLDGTVPEEKAIYRQRCVKCGKEKVSAFPPGNSIFLCPRGCT